MLIVIIENTSIFKIIRPQRKIPVLSKFDIGGEEVVTVAISLQGLPASVHVHAETLLR